MNDFLRNFIMTGIRNMIERDVPLYQVYKYAAGWYDKEVLVDEDLVEIQDSFVSSEKAIDEGDK